MKACLNSTSGAGQVPLPEDPPWWELHNVRYEDICEVCWEVQRLYQQPKARYVDVLEQRAQPGSVGGTPQASPMAAHGSPASAGAAVVSGAREAAAADSSAHPADASGAGDDPAQAALPNGVLPPALLAILSFRHPLKCQ
jgi:hypothetical protein